MSRAYRISVSDSRREHVVVDDCVATELELLAILPQKRMAELLAAELAARGFVRDEKNPSSMTREDGEVSISIDLEKGKISVRVREEKEVEAHAEISRIAGAESAVIRAELGEKVQKRLDAAVASEKKKLTNELAARLDKQLRDLRGELDAATTAVTREALKQKAAELGEIEEISEDAESGSITIKVRV